VGGEEDLTRLVFFSILQTFRVRFSNGVSPKSLHKRDDGGNQDQSRSQGNRREKHCCLGLPPKRTRRPWIAECGIKSTIKKSQKAQRKIEKKRTKSNGNLTRKLLPDSFLFSFETFENGQRERDSPCSYKKRSVVSWIARFNPSPSLFGKNNNGPHTQSLISFNNSHNNNPLFRCFFFFPRHKFCFLLFLWHGCGEGSSRFDYYKSTDKIRKNYKTKWFNKCQRGKTETRATCSPRMKSCWTCLWHSSSLRSIGWRWTANPVKGSLFLWFDGPGAEGILSLLSSLDVVNEPRASVMWSTGPERKKNKQNKPQHF
jgi:hypothetical protein